MCRFERGSVSRHFFSLNFLPQKGKYEGIGGCWYSDRRTFRIHFAPLGLGKHKPFGKNAPASDATTSQKRPYNLI